MIPKYERVLVVTDFSSTGNYAIGHAFTVAATGGQVHLLHLILHSDAPSPLYSHYVVDEASSLEKRRRSIQDSDEHLRSLIPAEAAAKGVEAVVATVIAPEIAPAIVSEAARRKADVIVLGAHVRRGLRNLLRGSVALDVVVESDLPVLLVRKP